MDAERACKKVRPVIRKRMQMGERAERTAVLLCGVSAEGTGIQIGDSER